MINDTGCFLINQKDSKSEVLKSANFLTIFFRLVIIPTLRKCKGKMGKNSLDANFGNYIIFDIEKFKIFFSA